MTEFPSKPTVGEAAASRPRTDVTLGWSDALLRLPTDPIIQGHGYDLAAYETILRDDQVKATLEQRRRAVVSSEWDVEPGGTSRKERKAAEFIREQLDALQFDDLTDKMLYALFYGWATAEIVWQRGSEVTIDAIKVRNRRRFAWDWAGELRLRLPDDPQGLPMPADKFWTFAVGADHDDEPYGRGLAHWLYWPVLFKRNGMKFWLYFLERFASPTVIGTHPAGALDPERKKLLEACQAVKQDAAVVVPEGTQIALLEAVRGGAGSYPELVAAMDAAIAKIVLSQTMTTDSGSSRSQAEVHMDVREEVVKGDADLVCSSFNRQVIARLCRWNFGEGVTPPRVWRRTEAAPDLEALVKRDQILFSMGYKPTPAYVEETYGEGFLAEPPPAAPAAAQDPAATDPAATPAEPPPGEPDAALAAGEADPAAGLASELLGRSLPAGDAVVTALRAAVDGASSLEEVTARLLRAEAPVAELADRLREALVLAELQGLAELQDPDGGPG
jgi:phage gp29-like protein